MGGDGAACQGGRGGRFGQVDGGRTGTQWLGRVGLRVKAVGGRHHGGEVAQGSMCGKQSEKEIFP